MSELIKYLKEAKSPYHAVKFAEKKLKESGFKELDFKKEFKLKEGEKYFVSPYPTSLFAFKIGEKATGTGIHIACAHTDSPTFRIKPAPEMNVTAGVYKVNVEPYGGMLKKTWFDRPLAVAGEVMVRSANPYEPEKRLFDSACPWFIIPSLAPHMDREIEEKKLDAQKELMPIFAIDEKEEGYEKSFIKAVADKLKVKKEDILSFDLTFYIYEEPVLCGVNGDLLLAARIDNIASCAALCEAITDDKKAKRGSKDTNDISLIALYDNEEIGSRTKQGADSYILNMIIDKIFDSSLYKGKSKAGAVAQSKMLSVDGAHAVHPNYPEKADVTTQSLLGKGVVFKTSASQRYVTDPEMSAVLAGLCDKEKIPYQFQANRSGAPGGQTLGPIVSSYLPIPAADLGVAMLGMHSAKETMCMKDYDALLKLSKVWIG